MASDSVPPESGGGAPGSGGGGRKITAAEIARDWGTSRAYVSNCITKKGCPTDSLEAARAWRESNARYGVGYRSKKPAAPAGEVRVEKKEEVTSPVGHVVEQTDLSSLEKSLKAAITVEEEALRLVREAQLGKEKGSVLESRLRAYNVACKNRSERESAVREEKERQRILVPMSEAKALFGRGWQVVVPKLRALGSVIGIRCNQDNPLLAADTIDAEIASIMAEGEKAYAA